jgi:hypothetical protein
MTPLHLGPAHAALTSNVRMQALLDELLVLHNLTQLGHLHIDAVGDRRERLACADIRRVLDGLARVVPEHIGRLVSYLYSHGVEPTRQVSVTDPLLPAFDCEAGAALVVLDSLCMHLRRTRVALNATLLGRPSLDPVGRRLVAGISIDVAVHNNMATARRHRQSYHCPPSVNRGGHSNQPRVHPQSLGGLKAARAYRNN